MTVPPKRRTDGSLQYLLQRSTQGSISLRYRSDPTIQLDHCASLLSSKAADTG